MTSNRCGHCGGWGKRPLTLEPYIYKCVNCSRTWGDNPDYVYPEERFATPMFDRSFNHFQHAMDMRWSAHLANVRAQ